MQHLPDLARPYAPLILALIVWPLVSAALTYALWWDTPARWDAFVAAHPRAAFAVRILRALSPHLRKLVIAWRDLAASRSALPLSALAEKTGALVVSETRPADPADEDTHASIVPPPPFDPHRTQRGSISLRALLAVVVGLAVVLPLGVGLYGCPASRQLTRPALGPVDGCEPRSTRCAPDGRPQVCSGSRRWTDADAVCALGVNVSAVCCLTRSPVTGAELHACVLAERCLPVDGGTR